MSSTKLMILALLAAFALSAVVLTPALAEPKKCATGSTHWVFCYNNNEEMWGSSNPPHTPRGPE